MTWVQFWLIFGFGLLTSIHCVQMCGPIVLAYSLPVARQESRMRLRASHVFYNLGRVTTYTFLGALAGAAGGAIGVAGTLAGIAQGTRVFAGAAMIVAGIYLSGLISAGNVIRIDRPGIAARLSRLGKRFLLSINPSSKFRLGLALGFLPCGLIYAALLKAVDAGSVAGGALTMLAFGLGTSVALMATGLASHVLGARMGRWSNTVAAAGIIFTGVLLVWAGIAGSPTHHHAGY